jgi:hypothetical protein
LRAISDEDQNGYAERTKFNALEMPFKVLLVGYFDDVFGFLAEQKDLFPA